MVTLILLGPVATGAGAAGEPRLSVSPAEGPPGTQGTVDGSELASCPKPRLLFAGQEHPSQVVKQTAPSLMLASTVPEGQKEGVDEVNLWCVDPDSTYVTVAGTASRVTARTVMVPALRGMSIETATSAVEKADLRLVAVGSTSGRVTDQRPAPDSQVPPGSEVAVTLEDPPVEREAGSVPALRGKEVRAARASLEAIGLALGGNVADDDVIVDQQPTPDTLVPVGTVVTVTVAAPTARWTVVPALGGMRVDVARTTLAAADLTLAGPVRANGRVVGQNPPAGTRVVRGTPIAVTLRPPPSGRWPMVLVAILAAAALVVAGRAWRRRRTRRWVHRRLGFSARPSPPAPPGLSFPGDSGTQTHAIRLEAHSRRGTPVLEEVQR